MAKGGPRGVRGTEGRGSESSGGLTRAGRDARGHPCQVKSNEGPGEADRPRDHRLVSMYTRTRSQRRGNVGTDGRYKAPNPIGFVAQMPSRALAQGSYESQGYPAYERYEKVHP